MRSFDRGERGFSLIEVMVSLTIVLAAVAMGTTAFKNCGRTHKKIVAGEATEAEVSLVVTRIEKDFAHAGASSLGLPKGPYSTRLTLQQSNGQARVYQGECRPGSPLSLPMTNWKGDCFKAVACPTGQTAVIRAPDGDTYPSGNAKDGAFAYALCAQDIGAGGIRVIVDAAVVLDEGQEPRVITKRKVLSRNAALGGEIQLLPKP